MNLNFFFNLVFAFTVTIINCQQHPSNKLLDLLFPINIRPNNTIASSIQFQFPGFDSSLSFPFFSLQHNSQNEFDDEYRPLPSAEPEKSYLNDPDSNEQSASFQLLGSFDNSFQQEQNSVFQENQPLFFNFNTTFAPFTNEFQFFQPNTTLEEFKRPKLFSPSNLDIQTYLDNLLKQFTNQINNQLQTSYQAIVSQTFQDIFATFQTSALNGQPLDMNVVLNNLVNKLQDTLFKVIPKTIEDQFNREAFKIIDDQFDGIKSILKVRLPFSTPILENTVLNMKNKLKELVPLTTQLFSNEIVKLIKSQLRL